MIDGQTNVPQFIEHGTEWEENSSFWWLTDLTHINTEVELMSSYGTSNLWFYDQTSV